MAFSAQRPGGTSGGLSHFLIGFALTFGGLYLFVSRVYVTSGFFSGGHYGGMFGGMFGGYGAGGSVGVVLVPFIVGIAALFANVRSKLGWGLFIGSLVLMFFLIVMSLRFEFAPTPLPVFLAMFGMVAAGLGLLIRSLFGFAND